MKKWLFVAMLAACLTAAAQQPDRRQRSAAERQLRQQRFTERLDSLVVSERFQFLPVSMEWGPRGGSQIINDFYYYVGVFKDRLQVHMPVVIGRAFTYNAIANFDTDRMSGYRTVKTDTGWKVSFAAEDNTGTAYTFVFTIYNVTGRTILDMVSSKNLMQYTGTVVANDEIPESTDPAPPMKRGPDGKLVPEEI